MRSKSRLSPVALYRVYAHARRPQHAKHVHRRSTVSSTVGARRRLSRRRVTRHGHASTLGGQGHSRRAAPAVATAHPSPSQHPPSREQRWRSQVVLTRGRCARRACSPTEVTHRHAAHAHAHTPLISRKLGSQHHPLDGAGAPHSPPFIATHYCVSPARSVVDLRDLGLPGGRGEGAGAACWRCLASIASRKRASSW